MRYDFDGVVIQGVAGVVAKTPTLVSSTEFLGEKKGKKFSLVTGIESISLFPEEVFFSDAGALAGSELLDRLGVRPESIGLLLGCTQSADCVLPPVTSFIHHRLGLKEDCGVLDVNQGCNALPSILGTACSVMTTSDIEHCLVVLGDLSSRHVATSVGSERALFGDAVCALLLTRGDGQIKGDVRTLSADNEAILLPQSNSAGRFPGGTDNLNLDGEAVYNFATSTASRMINEFLARNGLTISDVDYLSLHQANRAINNSIVKKVGASEEIVLSTLKKYGNTSSASIALNLAAMNEVHGRTLLCGFGVGLSCGVALYESQVVTKCLLLEI